MVAAPGRGFFAFLSGSISIVRSLEPRKNRTGRGSDSYLCELLGYVWAQWTPAAAFNRFCSRSPKELTRSDAGPVHRHFSSADIVFLLSGLGDQREERRFRSVGSGPLCDLFRQPFRYRHPVITGPGQRGGLGENPLLRPPGDADTKC